MVERVTEVYAVKLNVNGIEFGGEPGEIIEMFDRLLEHHSPSTEGLHLTTTDDFKGLLIKSRVAFSDSLGRLYPTDEFRMISRDLLAGLRSL